MRLRGLLALAVGVLLAADAKDEDFQKELKKLEGTWVLISGEVDGKKVSDEHVKKSKITFKGTAVAVDTPHQSSETIKSTITKLDATKTPHEMHWTREVGPSVGKTMKAVYEFMGPDQIRFCFDPSGKETPKEFKTKEGSGHVLHVWKRVKE
jgi:uncharacterized protein (TIGR03067 family)